MCKLQITTHISVKVFILIELLLVGKIPQHSFCNKITYFFIIGGTGSGSAPDGACLADDLECLGNVHDRLGMEAIKSLHQQLDDDDNGNIDLTESDDVSSIPKKH